ncbi:translesion error-prone DNA polymerase V autoproteolytic subunit (plasmid) [Brevundimonas sp. BH3]|uniref:LexA family protein n=1 Tax=Brevundimonas sp. BH3 TaxID=3133089 RepID=UPI003158525F
MEMVAASARLLQHSAEPVLVPVMGAKVCAGFPSPADDYIEGAIDLSQILIINPISTFIWKVDGWSVKDSGINDGDYVVVDRSVTAKAGDVVVAIIDGQASLKCIRKRLGRLILDFDNKDMGHLEISEASEVIVWGVVLWSLTQHRKLA